MSDSLSIQLPSKLSITNAWDIISILLIVAVILIILVLVMFIVGYSHWLVKKYLKLRKLRKQESLDRKAVGGDVYEAARRYSNQVNPRATYAERIAESESGSDDDDADDIMMAEAMDEKQHTGKGC